MDDAEFREAVLGVFEEILGTLQDIRSAIGTRGADDPTVLDLLSSQADATEDTLATVKDAVDRAGAEYGKVSEGFAAVLPQLQGAPPV